MLIYFINHAHRDYPATLMSTRECAENSRGHLPKLQGQEYIAWPTMHSTCLEKVVVSNHACLNAHSKSKREVSRRISAAFCAL